MKDFLITEPSDIDKCFTWLDGEASKLIKDGAVQVNVSPYAEQKDNYEFDEIEDKGYFVIDREKKLEDYFLFFRFLWLKHKFVTTTWRIGSKRSLDQNALFHVWIAEYASHLTGIPLKEINKKQNLGIREGMKRRIKVNYYSDTKERHMVYAILDPKTGVRKKDFVSSSYYSRLEMYNLLCWLQSTAAIDGLILEAKGEFKDLQEKEKEALL